MGKSNKKNVNRLVVGQFSVPKHHVFIAVICLSILLVLVSGLLLLTSNNKPNTTVAAPESKLSSYNTNKVTGKVSQYKIETVQEGIEGETVTENSQVKIAYQVYDPMSGSIIDSKKADYTKAEFVSMTAVPYPLKAGLIGRKKSTLLTYYLNELFTKELFTANAISSTTENGSIVELKLLDIRLK